MRRTTEISRTDFKSKRKDDVITRTGVESELSLTEDKWEEEIIDNEYDTTITIDGNIQFHIDEYAEVPVGESNNYTVTTKQKIDLTFYERLRIKWATTYDHSPHNSFYLFISKDKDAHNNFTMEELVTVGEIEKHKYCEILDKNSKEEAEWNELDISHIMGEYYLILGVLHVDEVTGESFFITNITLNDDIIYYQGKKYYFYDQIYRGAS